MAVSLAWRIAISGGSVVDTWIAGDFTAMVAAFDAWWTAMKPYFSPELKYDRIKVYKDGPGIVPPQLPVYDVEKDVAGTSSSNPLPPQVAVAVTEIAGAKPYWGRFYLPAPVDSNLDQYGRILTASAGAWADATDTLYQALKTAGLHPVVYRRELPEREKTNGATLPARDATAWDVEKIQIDDIFDVIRSRRFKQPLLRTQREIT